LSSYPSLDRIWMGLEEGSIRPAAYSQVRSMTSDLVVIHAKDGDTLEKLQHWATIDPEQLDLDRQSLELEKKAVEKKLEESRQTANETQIRSRLELAEAERRRMELAAAAEDPQISTALKNRISSALKEIDEQMVTLRDKTNPEKIEGYLDLEAQEGNVQIERKLKTLTALEKRSKLTAPFSGELRLTDTIKERLAASTLPDRAIWVDSNEHIATIVDDQAYEISVLATSPLLSQIPKENLLVFLQESQTGRLISGSYTRTDEIDSGAEIVQNYIFSIPGDTVDSARHSMGQRSLVHVYRKFPEKYFLVQKRDIAFSNPEVLESSGWVGLVMHLWPGSEVVQVGPQTIAVKGKK